MKKIAATLILTAVLLLLAGPAAAGGPIDTLSDTYNPNTGTGTALVWIGDNIYAYIQYVDTDGDGQYSLGDKVVRQLLVRLMPL